VYPNNLKSSVFSNTDFSDCSIKPKPSQKLTCFKDNQVVLFLKFLQISIPVAQVEAYNSIPFVEIEEGKYKFAAVRTSSVGDLLAEFSMKPADPIPWIVVIQDAFDAEYVMGRGLDGQVSLSSIQFAIEQSMVRTEEGEVLEVKFSDTMESEIGNTGVCIQLTVK
jgi:hypothetical protein